MSEAEKLADSLAEVGKKMRQGIQEGLKMAEPGKVLKDEPFMTLSFERPVDEKNVYDRINDRLQPAADLLSELYGRGLDINGLSGLVEALTDFRDELFRQAELARLIDRIVLDK